MNHSFEFQTVGKFALTNFPKPHKIINVKVKHQMIYILIRLSSSSHTIHNAQNDKWN